MFVFLTLLQLNLAIASSNIDPDKAAVVGKADILVEEALPPAKFTQGVIRLANGLEFEVISAETHELRHHLNELSPEDLEVFKKKRIERLISMAKYLSFHKLSSGLGYIENDRLSMIRDGVVPENPNPLDMLIAEDAKASPVEVSSAEKRVHKLSMIQKILKFYDNKTFENSKSFVGGREYCFELSLAPMMVIGVGNRMFGGMAGFTMIIGYDKDSKRVSFQLKWSKEKPAKGLAFIPLGLNVRIGAFSRSTTYLPKSFDVTYHPVSPTYNVSSNGIKGGGVSLPITALGALTMGAFTFLEQFMAYTGPSHTVDIVNTSFRLKIASFDAFIQTLKGVIGMGKKFRCQALFSGT